MHRWARATILRRMYNSTDADDTLRTHFEGTQMASEKLTFTSVKLISMKRDNKGAVAKFSSTLNERILTKMGWTEAPECYTGGDLEGEIQATVLELEPSEANLARHAFTLDGIRIHSFNTVRRELEKTRGKGHRTELHFKVTAGDMKALEKLERYWNSGTEKGKIIVSYEKPAEQADLPGAEVDTGCILCNANVPLMEGNPKKHDNNKKCTRTPVQEEMPVQ